MATKGDVELVIRARNEASKSLDSITKALSDLVGHQDDLSKSSAKAGDVLAGFAKVAATVSAAYAKIGSDSDRAAASLARQESVLNENRAVYQSLVSQMESAARVQERLTQKSNELAAAQEKVRRGQTRYGPPTRDVAEQMQSLAAAQQDAQRGASAAAAAQEQLQRQIERTAATVATQEKAFQQSFYALQDITGNAEKAAAALDKVRAAQERAGQAAAEAAAKQDQSSQAMARRSALELRRSLQEAAAGAQSGWQAAQQSIQQIAQTMAQVGPPTREQAANMAALSSAARANKTAYNEAQVAIEQFTRVLRTQGSDSAAVAAAQERARAALAGVRNTMVDVSSIALRTGQAFNSMGDAGRRAATGTSDLDRSLQSLFANSRRSLSLYQRWRGEVLSLVSSYVGLMGAINGVNQSIQASMQMQAVESRLNVVTGGDSAKTASELQWVKDEADRLGFSLTTLAGEWSKFAVSAQASNFSMEEARKIFTSVSEAGRVLKLDSQQVERAFVALTQMMSKGTIQMEELRQQLGEHIPGAFALMAQAVGVSGAELTKMMEQGQLTSDYLLKFADVLDARFGQQLPKALEMTQAELGRFQTGVTLALNKIADSGVLEAFTEALRDLQERLRSPEAEVWFERIGAAVGGVIRALMALLDNLDLIMTALAALGAAKGVAYIMSLTKAIATMVTGIRTAQTAAAGLSVAMAGIGGPIGIAIGLLAGAFAFLATRVRESETSMISAKRAVDDITQAYRNGAKSAKDWADAMKGLSSLQIDRDLSNLRNKLKDDLEDIIQPFGRGYMTRVRNSDSPLKAVFEEIQQLSEQARSGQLPLSEFKKRLDAVAEAHPQFKELALRMQDSAAEAIKSEDALMRFEASLRLMRGQATQADKELLGVADAIDKTDEAATNGARGLDKYNEAMERLAKRIPGLKKELEFQQSFKAIQEDLQKAFDAAGNDEGLKKAAMDRANAAMAALREGYDESLIKEFANTRGDGLLKSVNLLKHFESFRSTPYWDVNAYRVGYGSDTVTLDDGSIRKVTQGITVTQQDALRDLVRRIGEFQEGIKNQIGSERFNAFSPEQQAALTSIAYNYGSLPRRILDAVKTGTAEEIAAAVRGLRGDNGGINAGRRDAEAAILANPNAALAANTAKQVQAQVDQTLKVVTDLNRQIAQANLTDREKYIRDALERAGIDSVVKAVQGMLEEGNIDLTKRPQVRNADGSVSTVRSISVEVDGKVALIPTVSDDGKVMSDEQAVAQFQRTGKHLGMFSTEEAAEQYAEALHKQQEKFYSEDAQRIAQIAGQAFDQQAGEKAKVKISELQSQLAGGQAAISREEFIANEARKDGIDLLSEQGRKYAELKGQLFDREQAEKRVNDLVALRKELQEQVEFNQGQGNFEAAARLQTDLDGVNSRLKEAIANALQFYQAMGGPGADLAIAKLNNLNNSLVTNARITLDAKQINQSFAQGAANAFGKVGDAIGAWIDGTKTGKEALEDIRDAFLQFAADFLKQIAQMIFQQIIFNMVSGALGGASGGSGGLGGMIAGMVRHNGGLADGTGVRMVSPSWFDNAVRYHTGGIAGLAPNEVPAILERNEEVLTRDDPRHVMNGGGQANVKIINAIDAGDFVSQGLNTEVGQQGILNYMSANSSAVKGALGLA